MWSRVTQWTPGELSDAAVPTRRTTHPAVLTVDPGPFAPRSMRPERLATWSASGARPHPAAITLPAAGRLGLLFLAGTMPVLSIPLQLFGVVPMTLTARFMVLPLAVLALAIMRGPSVQGAWAVQGLIAGLAAVTVYDAVRLPVGFAMGMPDFIPQIGGWVVGTGTPNAVAGYLWRYLGDGAGIGVAYFVTCGVAISLWPALVRTRPVLLSVYYGIFIWFGLVATVTLSASGASLLFPPTSTNLVLSLVGHLVYGGVLGLWLRYVLSGPVTGAWPRTQWQRRSQPAGRAAQPQPRLDRAASPVWASVRPVPSAPASETADGSVSRRELTAVAHPASAPPYRDAARWPTSAPPYQAAAHWYQAAAQSQASAPPYQSEPLYARSWQMSAPPYHVAEPDQIVTPHQAEGADTPASGRDARNPNEGRFAHQTVWRPGDTQPRNRP